MLNDLDVALSLADPIKTYHSLDLFWARLSVHIRAEHLVVFPAVKRSVAEDSSRQCELKDILARLRSDHDLFIKQLARAVKAMRLVPEFGNEAETFVIVKGLVDNVRQRLIEHNRIEEEVIYPMVGQSANDNVDMDEISVETLKQLTNLPSRFINSG